MVERVVYIRNQLRGHDRFRVWHVSKHGSNRMKIACQRRCIRGSDRGYGQYAGGWTSELYNHGQWSVASIKKSHLQIFRGPKGSYHLKGRFSLWESHVLAHVRSSVCVSGSLVFGSWVLISKHATQCAMSWVAFHSTLLGFLNSSLLITHHPPLFLTTLDNTTMQAPLLQQ